MWMRFVPNAVAFGGVAAGSTKAKDQQQVANVSILIGCVSVDRATAVFGTMSVNPQMLKTVKEINPKLEKSPNFSPRQAVSDDSTKPFETTPSAPMRRATLPIPSSVLPLATRSLPALFEHNEYG